jgi:hypothetical protein
MQMKTALRQTLQDLKTKVMAIPGPRVSRRTADEQIAELREDVDALQKRSIALNKVRTTESDVFMFESLRRNILRKIKELEESANGEV